MNIKEAKNEIKNTVQAYLKKDEMGDYKIPSVRQRPILLMGPPGYGTDRTGVQSCISGIQYYPPHETECGGTAVYPGDLL